MGSERRDRFNRTYHFESLKADPPLKKLPENMQMREWSMSSFRWKRTGDDLSFTTSLAIAVSDGSKQETVLRGVLHFPYQDGGYEKAVRITLKPLLRRALHGDRRIKREIEEERPSQPNR